MPHVVDLAARSPHSITRIRSAFDDESYWRTRLSAFEGGSPVLDEITCDEAGLTSVTMTMTFSGDQLPPALQRLRLPSLQIVQREQWYPIDGDTLRGEITVDATKTPMSGRGSILLRPDGPGTRLDGTATVRVHVPIIGGPIGRFVASLLRRGILDIVGVTDSWLSADGVAT